MRHLMLFRTADLLVILLIACILYYISNGHGEEEIEESEIVLRPWDSALIQSSYVDFDESKAAVTGFFRFLLHSFFVVIALTSFSLIDLWHSNWYIQNVLPPIGIGLIPIMYLLTTWNNTGKVYPIIPIGFVDLCYVFLFTGFRFGTILFIVSLSFLMEIIVGIAMDKTAVVFCVEMLYLIIFQGFGFIIYIRCYMIAIEFLYAEAYPLIAINYLDYINQLQTHALTALEAEYTQAREKLLAMDQLSNPAELCRSPSEQAINNKLLNTYCGSKKRSLKRQETLLSKNSLDTDFIKNKTQFSHDALQQACALEDEGNNRCNCKMSNRQNACYDLKGRITKNNSLFRYEPITGLGCPPETEHSVYDHLVSNNTDFYSLFNRKQGNREVECEEGYGENINFYAAGRPRNDNQLLPKRNNQGHLKTRQWTENKHKKLYSFHGESSHEDVFRARSNSTMVTNCQINDNNNNNAATCKKDNFNSSATTTIMDKNSNNNAVYGSSRKVRFTQSESKKWTKLSSTKDVEDFEYIDDNSGIFHDVSYDTKHISRNIKSKLTAVSQSNDYVENIISANNYDNRDAIGADKENVSTITKRNASQQRRDCRHKSYNHYQSSPVIPREQALDHFGRIQVEQVRSEIQYYRRLGILGNPTVNAEWRAMIWSFRHYLESQINPCVSYGAEGFLPFQKINQKHIANDASDSSSVLSDYDFKPLSYDKKTCSTVSYDKDNPITDIEARTSVTPRSSPRRNLAAAEHFTETTNTTIAETCVEGYITSQERSANIFQPPNLLPNYDFHHVPSENSANPIKQAFLAAQQSFESPKAEKGTGHLEQSSHLRRLSIFSPSRSRTGESTNKSFAAASFGRRRVLSPAKSPATQKNRNSADCSTSRSLKKLGSTNENRTLQTPSTCVASPITNFSRLDSIPLSKATAPTESMASSLRHSKRNAKQRGHVATSTPQEDILCCKEKHSLSEPLTQNFYPRRHSRYWNTRDNTMYTLRHTADGSMSTTIWRRASKTSFTTSSSSVSDITEGAFNIPVLIRRELNKTVRRTRRRFMDWRIKLIEWIRRKLWVLVETFGLQKPMHFVATAKFVLNLASWHKNPLLPEQHQFFLTFKNTIYERWYLDWARGASCESATIRNEIQIFGLVANILVMSCALVWMSHEARQVPTKQTITTDGYRHVLQTYIVSIPLYIILDLLLIVPQNTCVGAGKVHIVHALSMGSAINRLAISLVSIIAATPYVACDIAVYGQAILNAFIMPLGIQMRCGLPRMYFVIFVLLSNIAMLSTIENRMHVMQPLVLRMNLAFLHVALLMYLVFLRSQEDLRRRIFCLCTLPFLIQLTDITRKHALNNGSGFHLPLSLRSYVGVQSLTEKTLQTPAKTEKQQWRRRQSEPAKRALDAHLLKLCLHKRACKDGLRDAFCSEPLPTSYCTHLGRIPRSNTLLSLDASSAPRFAAQNRSHLRRPCKNLLYSPNSWEGEGTSSIGEDGNSSSFFDAETSSTNTSNTSFEVPIAPTREWESLQNAFKREEVRLSDLEQRLAEPRSPYANLPRLRSESVATATSGTSPLSNNNNEQSWDLAEFCVLRRFPRVRRMSSVTTNRSTKALPSARIDYHGSSPSHRQFNRHIIPLQKLLIFPHVCRTSRTTKETIFFNEPVHYFDLPSQRKRSQSFFGHTPSRSILAHQNDRELTPQTDAPFIRYINEVFASPAPNMIQLQGQNYTSKVLKDKKLLKVHQQPKQVVQQKTFFKDTRHGSFCSSRDAIESSPLKKKEDIASSKETSESFFRRKLTVSFLSSSDDDEEDHHIKTSRNISEVPSLPYFVPHAMQKSARPFSRFGRTHINIDQLGGIAGNLDLTEPMSYTNNQNNFFEESNEDIIATDDTTNTKTKLHDIELHETQQPYSLSTVKVPHVPPYFT